MENLDKNKRIGLFIAGLFGFFLLFAIGNHLASQASPFVVTLAAVSTGLLFTIGFGFLLYYFMNYDPEAKKEKKSKSRAHK